jgi:hypothetical protein
MMARIVSVFVAVTGLAVALFAAITVHACCSGRPPSPQDRLANTVFGIVVMTSAAGAAVIAPRRDVCAPVVLSLAMVFIYVLGMALSLSESGTVRPDSLVGSVSGLLGAWLGYAMVEVFRQKHVSR